MPKPLLTTVLALAALFVAAGCASQGMQVPNDDERVQARVYAAPYDEVYAAALEAAAAMNWRITEEDREGGLLTAETPEATPGGTLDDRDPAPNHPTDKQEDNVDVVFLRNEEGVRVEIVSALRFESNVEDARAFLDGIAERLGS